MLYRRLALPAIGLSVLCACLAQNPRPQVKLPDSGRTLPQVRSVRDTYERKPLIMAKIDGTQTPYPTDRGSLILCAQAVVSFALPDRPDFPNEMVVLYSVRRPGERNQYKSVPVGGNFPPPGLSNFEVNTSSVPRLRLSVNFERQDCSYRLSLIGVGNRQGNSTPLMHAKAVDDLLFFVNVFDDAKKIAYFGRIPVRVVETNDRK